MKRNTDNAAHDGEWLNAPLEMFHANTHVAHLDEGCGMSIIPACWCAPEPVGIDGSRQLFLHIKAEAAHALMN